MAWARIDDGFHDHPKVDGLSLAAVGLWSLCLTWAHRHRRTAPLPGHITEARVRKLAGKQAQPLADELFMAGLWEVAPAGGWVIHDFADYLPKERDPDERKEAGRKGAASRWKTDSKLPSDGMASDSSRASAPASPSRTRPEGETSLGGERPETSAPANATVPPKTKTAKCTRHPNGNPTDEPCDGCRNARERDERRIASDAEKAKRASEAAARDCRRCDGTWVTDPETALPTRHRCDHTRVVAASSGVVA